MINCSKLGGAKIYNIQLAANKLSFFNKKNIVNNYIAYNEYNTSNILMVSAQSFMS